MGLCGASLEGTHNLLSAPSSSWLVLSPFRFSRKVRPWCMMQSNDAPDIHPSFSLALARQEGWGVLCASSRLPRRTHGWRGRDYVPHQSVLVSFCHGRRVHTRTICPRLASVPVCLLPFLHPREASSCPVPSLRTRCAVPRTASPSWRAQHANMS